MLYELDKTDYAKVRSLFAELDAYNFTLGAVLDGISPGRILADDPDHPRSALAYTPEGAHLAGDSSNIDFVAAVNAYLVEKFYNDEPTVDGEMINLCCHPESWLEQMPALLAPREPLILLGYHYVCAELKYTHWREHLPPGFAVRRIDAELLQTPGLDIPDHILEWINDNWGTREHFLQYGFGFCVIHENQITHWSLTDCVTKDGRCDIGIWSIPGYRRQGLAAITAAAAVEHALTHGSTQVGWHCVQDNVGSYKTAERVGFAREREVAVRYCMFSSVHQVAEKGWYHLRNGRHSESAAAYEQLFALGADYPHYIYHEAARAQAGVGHYPETLRLLHAAIDRGWPHRDYTQNACPEFAPLYGTPEWEAVLARMQE